jgi:hypothetical protein
MFGKISTSQRIKTGLALALVFILVLATNRIDKNHFETAQFSMRSILDDRLQAKNYLFKMKDIAHQEHIEQLDSLRPPFASTGSKMDELLAQFQGTRLTQNERLQLKKMKKRLQNYESQKVEAGILVRVKELERIQQVIMALAEIQLEEGRTLVAQAQKSLNSNSFMSRIEIVILVITGLMIQFLIFYRTAAEREQG